MKLPNKKKYDNGRLPTYYFLRTFNIRGKCYERGDIYDLYGYTYDDFIWRLREGIILPETMRETTYQFTEHVEVDVTYTIQKHQLDPSGPEEVGKEKMVDVVVVDDITDMRVHPSFIEEHLFFPVDFSNEDYKKRLITYIEDQMTQDVDDYKDGE